MNTQERKTWKDVLSLNQWLSFAQWGSLMTTIIVCLGIAHHENSSLTNRLDNHITQINNRCDELHKEFYALLKEMRK